MAKIAPYLAFVIGLALAVLAVPAAVDELQMRKDVDSFKSTRAEVVEFREQKHPKGPTTQVVRFKYEVDGTKYSGDNRYTRMSNTHAEVESLIRDENDKTRSILVYYDPTNPKRVVISKDVGIWVPLGIIFASGALLVTSVYSFVEAKRRRRMWNASTR